MKVEALSTTQERRLIDYLDEKFLEVSRAYKKRSHSSTTLPTLSAYLQATHSLLNLVLQIPPIDPSSSLRTTILLRLTGDVLTSIPGYSPDLQSLPELLDWLEDLDRAWVVVLRSQVWDPKTRKAGSIPFNERDHNHLQLSPMSQTERTRLRSLLISGSENLEEWLESLDSGSGSDIIERRFEEGASDVEELEIQTRFDQIFSDTLKEMGILHGETS